MTDPIDAQSLQDLPGLGPKSQAMLRQLNICTVSQFLACDPYQLYRQLHEANPQLSLNMLYAIIGAQENTPWQIITRERKTEILMTLDDIGLAP